MSLLGARIDDLVLVDYRETLAPNSPLVRLLEPRADPKPYYVQYGWSAAAGDWTVHPSLRSGAVAQYELDWCADSAAHPGPAENKACHHSY